MLLDLFFDSLKSIFGSFYTEKSVGAYGEQLTEQQLKALRIFGKKNCKILKNLYIPKDDGGMTEIDLVFISEKGIFVLESKNYSGWIFGDETSAFWTQMLANKQKNRFYSPILQNRNHIKWLKNYLWIHLYDEIPMFSFIVFSERCELKKMHVSDAGVWVVKRNELLPNMINVLESTPDVLTDAQIIEIYKQLRQHTKVSETQKQAHVEAIRGKMTPQTKVEPLPVPVPSPSAEAAVQTAVSQPDKPENQMCPKCGAKLVLRVSKKGKNVGKEFYGCSKFPSCRYVKDVLQFDEQVEAAKTVCQEAESPMQSAPPICPWCGNALVIRTAKNGQNAGKKFLGCSNFPKCRYIQNI